MKSPTRLLSALFCCCALPLCAVTRQPDGDGSVQITGELQVWHKVTLNVDGPWAHERDETKNPFTDYRLTARFTHDDGTSTLAIPGYFAADGDAANTSAESGTRWRVNFAPPREGKWHYELSFISYRDAAFEKPESPVDACPGHETRGSFDISPADKTLPDLRARGRLRYVGGHHLRFAGDGTYFLKAGPDAPETFLAYSDFDGTRANNPGKGRLKTWQPHLRDWREGDPTWGDGKGKGIIGALNYLSASGLNAFSFLTYNAGGDGDNVWPFVERDEKTRYDCSKLDQWGIVFDHATRLGLHLHFKMQETEMDDDRRGHQEEKKTRVPTSLDGGRLGPERKLYIRELVARFGHHLALNWNLGEENTQSTEEQRAMAAHIRELDPYDHPIVIHTFPNQQDKVYPPLLGASSELTGASLQNGWNAVHQRTLKWIRESARAGKPWVIANDEQGPAGLGVPPDPGFRGFSGIARDKKAKTSRGYDIHDIRQLTLWGNLMAGGAGVEYYFGYQLPENDLLCEDFRSREQSWNFCRIALQFFRDEAIPFHTMTSANALVGNGGDENGKPWCLARKGSHYLVYLPSGTASVTLDLTGAEGTFRQTICDPMNGEPHRTGPGVTAGKKVTLANPLAGEASRSHTDCAIYLRAE